eukprot:Nitzschia sp. Nitz4//scaffold6_size259037//139739//140719//NITZ4_001083-RA/size259037-processed-gene-0.21-mRNA-1//1//CDS//3329556920//1035//frame0
MGEELPVVTPENCEVAPDNGSVASLVSDMNKERSSKVNKEVRQPFPCKVYEMLEDADSKGFSDVVAWNKEGNGFMVHNKDRFTKEIVPKYYNQTRYKSFQRQLSLYGFQRTTTGSNKGLRYHEKLQRGMKHLCREMKPVGYKPRGQEHREKLREKKLSEDKMITNACPDTTTTISISLAPGPAPSAGKQAIPNMVTSNPLFADPAPKPIPAESSVIRPKSGYELAEKLITTDSIVFFEGMPFYLMTAVTTTVESQPPQPEPVPVTSSEPPVLSNCGASSSVNMDGQMKKAWEIGFAVAMTMNSTPYGSTQGVVSVDSVEMPSLDVC